MMSVICVDFETTYSATYSLSKMTTEEYIRDPRFQIIGVGVKVDDTPAEWFSGSHAEIKEYLSRFDWGRSAVLAHNMMFDGAILSWRLGIRPKVLLDTLSMARALHGPNVSVSLKNLAVRYGVGEKGDEVIAALGKRRADFTREELARYGNYCKNDVELCRKLFDIMSEEFPKQELKLIDLTLRMFTEPVLCLDKPRLEAHLHTVVSEKEKLLASTGADKKQIMSNSKFAELLNSFGVEAPTKTSPATGKPTYAFAKTDTEFTDLAEHEDIRVQTLVASRLGTKSTLEETRTARFIGVANRGAFPVPLRYYAAHTGRWGGDDKINLQNLPSRGPSAKELKKAITAPEGYTLVEADSSQIEARVLAWLAEQNDVVDDFRNARDVYKRMASVIYNVAESDVTAEQRFVGKTTVLGAGYGMGGDKFYMALKLKGLDIPPPEAARIISVYRQTNYRISGLWRAAGKALSAMVRGTSMTFGRGGLLVADAAHTGIRLPNGLLIRYTDLTETVTDRGSEFSYATRTGRTRVYGGKVVENITQALARIIIGDQMIAIAKRYRPVLTVHDSIVCCVPDADTESAREYIETCMRKTPAWADDLPVTCESGVGKNYGSCQ